MGQWLCEAAVVPLESCRAAGGPHACKLIVVRTNDFEGVVVRRRRLSGVAWEYAQMFHTWLVASCPPLAS